MFWNPDDLSISGWMDGLASTLRPGTSQNIYLVMDFHDDGIYTVEFNQAFSDTIDVVITLPITRPTQSQPTPPTANQGADTNISASEGVEMYLVSQAWEDSVSPENVPAIAMYGDNTFDFVENVLWGIIRFQGTWQEVSIGVYDFQTTHIVEPDGSIVPLNNDWLEELGGGSFIMIDTGGQMEIEFGGDWNGGTRSGDVFGRMFPPNTPLPLIANPTSAW